MKTFAVLVALLLPIQAQAEVKIVPIAPTVVPDGVKQEVQASEAMQRTHECVVRSVREKLIRDSTRGYDYILQFDLAKERCQSVATVAFAIINTSFHPSTADRIRSDFMARSWGPVAVEKIISKVMEDGSVYELQRQHNYRESLKRDREWVKRGMP